MFAERLTFLESSCFLGTEYRVYAVFVISTNGLDFAAIICDPMELLLYLLLLQQQTDSNAVAAKHNAFSVIYLLSASF
jgi:hypothetical protein